MKAQVKGTNAAQIVVMNTNAGSEQVNAQTPANSLVKKEVINMVTITGNLGAAPEVVELTNGMKKAKFKVATNRYFKNKSGEWQSETSWHTVIAWGKLAVQAEKNLMKGSPVTIDGKVSYRMYTDKDGVSRFVTEIVAGKLAALPKKEAIEHRMAA